MDNIIQILLSTTPTEFDKWLTQEIPASRANIIVVSENGIPEIFDPAIQQLYTPDATFIKILGAPYTVKNNIGNTQYKVALCRGDLEEVEEEQGQFEDLLLLSITEASDNKLLVALNWGLSELRPYIKEFADQISLTWPESKRIIHRWSLAPFKHNEDSLLFEVIINTEPDPFFEWLEKDISENAGGIYFLDTFDETRYETQFINSELFPPDTQYNYWEHHLVASTKVFLRNTETNHWVSVQEFPFWVISRLEFIRSKDNKNRLRLIVDYVTPGTLLWFKDLETRIKLTFTQGFIEPDSQKMISTKKPQIPTNPSSLASWKGIWRKVKSSRLSGATFGTIYTLHNTHQPKSVRCSKRTLRRIIFAGEHGLLD